jgi:hypothetical protein
MRKDTQVATLTHNLPDDIQDDVPWPEAPEAPRPLTFTQALERAELLARHALPPEAHERLSAAVGLVKHGAVFQTSAGHWQVASTSEPGTEYTVNGTCSCLDSHYRGGICKHRYAVRLAQRTFALMQTPQDEAPAVAVLDADETPGDLVDVMPTTQPVGGPAQDMSLGEAPASCNVYVIISGHRVQVTLRDTDESRMLARLQVLLATYPAAPAQPVSAPPATPPPTPAAAEPPICQWHGAMRESTKAKGTYFCPAKMGDGSYCKERYLKA